MGTYLDHQVFQHRKAVFLDIVDNSDQMFDKCFVDIHLYNIKVKFVMKKKETQKNTTKQYDIDYYLTWCLWFHPVVARRILKPLTGHGFHGKQIRIFTLHGVIAVESAI